MAEPTPQLLSDVTASWLGEVLGAAVDDVHVQQIGAGEGFMGQLARVTFRDAGEPRSVIVKLPTSDPGGRAIGEMLRVWEREHRFYHEVAPAMSVRVPRALANIAGPPCLVLEDLSPMAVGDHVAGATLDQAERAIDVLARHHGHWFEHPRLAELDWMPGLDDQTVATIADSFAFGWPTFLDRYESELPARCLRWCERFVGGVQQWLATHLDDPITITHGDFRLDNIFFGPDHDDVAVIDWQMAMRAPGQADLVYFCANNLAVDVRRTHEDALVSRYVDALHATGVPAHAVTLEGVRRGYLEGLVFYGSTLCMGLLTIDPANPRGAALFDALVTRTFTAMDDLDAGAALGLGS